MDQRGYEIPDDLKDYFPRKIDAVLYGKEDTGEDASDWERLMSYDLLEPPEEREETEEDKVEAERLANWKANFPYQPTTDPNVVITEEMLIPSNMAEPPTRNHCFLRSFFENEARFTAQFEQLYHILEEHGRGDNPVVAGNILNCLWQYHEYSREDPDELSGWRNRTGEYAKTNAEVAEMFFEGIVTLPKTTSLRKIQAAAVAAQTAKTIFSPRCIGPNARRRSSSACPTLRIDNPSKRNRNFVSKHQVSGSKTADIGNPTNIHCKKPISSALGYNFLNCPRRTPFGGVPIKVATPPMLAA